MNQVSTMSPGDLTRSTSRPLPEALTTLYADAIKEVENVQDHQTLRELLRRYHDVFSLNDEDIGQTSWVEHHVPVQPGTRPIRQPARRMGPIKDAEVDQQVQDLVKRGLIEPSQSAWSSPVVLVKKKGGKWRFCIDYRRLNEVTIQDAHPIPRIDDSLDALAGNRYFSTLDLTSGYW